MTPNQPIQACMFLNSKPIYDSSEILEILCNIIRSKTKIYPLKNNTWNHSKDVFTNMSSFPKWVLMKSAKEEMVVGSITSSWWKTTSEHPAASSFSIASLPLLTSLAVKTTLIPFVANCLHISNPIPLLAPVTTAILG